MKTRRRIFICFFSMGLQFIIPSRIFSAWYIYDFQTSGQKREISNQAEEFMYGKIKCGVSETKFTRIEQSDDNDGQIVEYRELYCHVAENTIVSVSVTCQYPTYEMNQMAIKKNGKYLSSPSLLCGPKN